MKSFLSFLKKIDKLYQLEQTISHYSYADKQAVLDYILNDDIFYNLTPTLFDVKYLVEIFCDKQNRNLERENSIYQKLLRDDNGFLKLFDSVFSFKQTYKFFIHDALTEEQKAIRCQQLLELLAKSKAFAQVVHLGPYYIANFIGDDSVREKLILEWATKNGLIKTEQETQTILKKAAHYKKELAARKLQQETIQLANKPEAIPTYSSPWSPAFYQLTPEQHLQQLANADPYSEQNIKEVVTLIKQGVNCEVRDRNGNTPLISAAKLGNKILTLTLVGYGAKLNAQDQSGYMPEKYKRAYSCDHEYDPDACIPLKRAMDAPMRHLLEQLTTLEAKYLNQKTGRYDFNEIKNQISAIIHNQEFQSQTPLNAICGHVINNIEEAQKTTVLQFFKENLQNTFNIDSIPLKTALPPKKYTLKI